MDVSCPPAALDSILVPRSPRTILHLDMDAFYAAIEQRDKPELRGRPVVVGANPRGGRGRGVVSTASYEARRFGIGSAMPISRAYRLCPHATYVDVDMDHYVSVSRQIKEILREVTDLVEPVSIDEAFLDVTDARRTHGSGEQLARHLKQRIRDEIELTASVGVAASKLVAKIASDMRKPDGLVVVPPGEEGAFLAPLPIRRLWGVGPKAEEALLKVGIVTIGDLARCPPERLARRVGTHGLDLIRLAARAGRASRQRRRRAREVGRPGAHLRQRHRRPRAAAAHAARYRRRRRAASSQARPAGTDDHAQVSRRGVSHAHAIRDAPATHRRERRPVRGCVAPLRGRTPRSEGAPARYLRLGFPDAGSARALPRAEIGSRSRA